MVIWMKKRHYIDTTKILNLSQKKILTLMKHLNIYGVVHETSQDLIDAAMIYEVDKTQYVVHYIAGSEDGIKEIIQKYCDKLSRKTRNKIVFYIDENQIHLCNLIKEYGGIATHYQNNIRMVIMSEWLQLG